MALDSISTTNKFQQLGAILDGAKDKQHVKLDDSGKFKIGFSTLMGKIKYMQMSDKPHTTKGGYQMMGPRSESNMQDRIKLANTLTGAATQTVSTQLMKDLETLSKDPRYKDSPLLNSQDARNRTVQEFKNAFTEKYQATLETAVNASLGQGMAKNTIAGIERTTVGQLKGTVQALDSQLAKAYSDFLGTAVLGKLEANVGQVAENNVSVLTQSAILPDWTRGLGNALDLGPRAMGRLAAHHMEVNTKAEKLGTEAEKANAKKFAEGDLSFNFAKITDDKGGMSTVDIIRGMGLDKAAQDELMVNALLDKFDGGKLIFKLGDLTMNKTGGSEGTAFGQLNDARDRGLNPSKVDMMKAQVLMGELSVQDLPVAIKEAMVSQGGLGV